MILLGLIAIPAAAGLIAWYLGSGRAVAARNSCVVALALNLALVLRLWTESAYQPIEGTSALWLAEMDVPWIPQLGIRFHLAVDGLSLLLVGLVALVGIVALAAGSREGQERPGVFLLNVMATLAGITGVFLAVDLFLFYFFWELMLVPMYLLFLWGHERSHYAALKFFIFTQAGGLLMLLAILGLYFSHGKSTGSYSFDYAALLGTQLEPAFATLLMLGFFAGFAVKLPVIPLHSWLPDAYAESPTAATIMLAALMAKTGGYGLLRFVVPLFPGAAHDFAPIAMALAVGGILYGAVMAFAQTDVKRLIAYSSLSQMGFVLLGIFAWNTLAWQGAVVLMLAHGLSVGALFLLMGKIEESLGTRDLGRMGGLWSVVPRLSALMLFFVLATLALPGLGNFVGEFLVLMGSYRASIPATAIAALGVVLSAVYGLWLIQRTLHGPTERVSQIGDLSKQQTALIGVLVAAMAWLGLAPQPVLSLASQALSHLQQYSTTARPADATLGTQANAPTSVPPWDKGRHP